MISGDHIKKLAKAHGFNLIGIISPFKTKYKKELLSYIEKKQYHNMTWFSNNIEKRLNIEKAFKGLRSIISLASYYDILNKNINKEAEQVFSLYALINDYHTIMVKQAEYFIKDLIKKSNLSMRYKIYTDTGPILEKEIAQRAGLGFIGKNSLIINPELGSYLFLTEILLDIPIDFENKAIHNNCGTCNICIEACPTKALLPYTLIPERCISYLTIEYKGIIPDNLKKMMKNRVFGCDICQEVCPYNKSSGIKKIFHQEPSLFIINKNLINKDIIELINIKEKHFKDYFRNSVIYRCGHKSFLRNLLIIMGNSGNRDYLRIAEKYLKHESEIVRDSADYACRIL